ETSLSPRDERLAAMLYGVLEARDQLLACELDLDLVHADAMGTAVLPHLQAVMDDTAAALDALADALLLGRQPEASGLDATERLSAALASIDAPDTPAAEATAATATATGQTRTLLRNIVRRVGRVVTEVAQLHELARGERRADLSAQAQHWGLYVTPTAWPLQALRNQLNGRSPVLRYAVRLALALGVGFVVALHLPWASHKHWILLTIAVVMRINLAQTLERRNARVGGTLLGCLVAAGLLALHPSVAMIYMVIAMSTAVAHAFVLPRYFVAAVAATITGLMQSHLLIAGNFVITERLGDTVLGALLAWGCSYVLPAWERRQLPGLVNRVLRAQAKIASQALAMHEQQNSDTPWRLARREAYDSLSALTLAAQRTLAEPRAVQPPLQPLETLQLRSYRMLTHLSSMKAMLTQRRGELDLERVKPALKAAAEDIEDALRPGSPAAAQRSGTAEDKLRELVGDAAPPPSTTELTPWLLRRLHLTRLEAHELAQDAASLQGR
ncbi:MAG TPA: FUSC family protein, partial [Methylibium sp.]